MSTQRPEIMIFDTVETLADYAAERFAVLARRSIAARGSFVVALSGGSTPEPLYRRLASDAYAERIAWQHVHLFWGDERAVAADDPGSNYYQAQKLLSDQFAAAHVYRVHGELPVDEAAADYAEQLRQFAAQQQPRGRWPIFDLILLGIGSDGHTASLFPGSQPAQQQPVRAVTADYQGRPAQRVTLTEPVLNGGRNIFFLVSGAGKASIVKTIVAGERDLARYPAQRIQPAAGSLSLLLDAAAAAQIDDEA